MLIRASAKFRTHYTVKTIAGEAPVRPFPRTWNVDLLPHGRQLIILASEEYSLFSVLIPVGRSRDLETFLEPIRRRLRDLFENIGVWNMAFLPSFRFCNRTNQSLIGSQNELWRLTRAGLEDASKPLVARELLEIEQEINSAPMSYLGMDSPREALWKQKQKIFEQL